MYGSTRLTVNFIGNPLRFLLIGGAVYIDLCTMLCKALCNRVTDSLC